MASTIKLKNGSGAPTSGQLVQGEPALDLTNKRLYTENASGTVIEVGTNPAAEITANGGIALPDNQKATFGASDDLQIYHDGSNSYINDVGTGDLILQAGNDLVLRATNGTDEYLRANEGLGVQIFYNGSQKFLTTATGIDVTGTVTADGLTVENLGNTVQQSIYTSDNVSNATAKLSFGTTPGSREKARIEMTNTNTGNAAGSLTLLTNDGSSLNDRLLIASNGDISFYEDTGTTAKFFWDASAESLGIGTTSPAFYQGSGLEIERAGIATVRLQNTTTGKSAELKIDTDVTLETINTGSSLLFNTAATERMRIDSSGNVGIGTSSPSAALDVVGEATVGNGTYGIKLSYSAGSTAGVIDTADSATTLSVRTSGSERMRIDSSGNLLVGTTNLYPADNNVTGHSLTAIGQLQSSVSGYAPFVGNRKTSDGAIALFKKDGTTVGSISVTSSTTTYNITSDQRLKENITDAPAGNVDDIKVRSFDWKADGSHQDYGMVAQELEAVAPYAVTKGETEDDMWSVDYSKLVPMLIKEIQDLKAEVAALKGA